MERATTNNVEVAVETWYHDQASNPGEGNFVYAYEVTITNHGNDMVQLLSREWHIKDAVGETKIIKGIGVVGEQPLLAPGEFHRYISGCNFNTEMGSMHGFYVFKSITRDKMFKVKIPKFVLAFPYSLN